MSVSKFDPAFDDPIASEYFDEMWEIFEGVPYDKQVLVHSAILAKRIKQYAPEMAEFSWNPWNVEEFVDATNRFADAMHSRLPIYCINDSFMQAVNSVFYFHVDGQGFHVEYAGFHSLHDMDIMRYLVALHSVDGDWRDVGNIRNYNDELKKRGVLADAHLPLVPFHEYIGSLTWLINSEFSLSETTIIEAEALLDSGVELTVEQRVLQFVWLINYTFLSTPYRILNEDVEMVSYSDTVFDLDNREEIDYAMQEWKRSLVYLRMIGDLSAWSISDHSNLEFLLSLIRRAYDVAVLRGLERDLHLRNPRFADSEEAAATAAEIASVYIEVGGDDGFFHQLDVVEPEILEEARRLILEAGGTIAQI